MAEDELYIRTTTLLAEHLGFAPIEAVDDIINVINDIMYTCTEQLEHILIDRMDKATDGDKYTQKEVESGTAQLESLLEHVINKNFDKFELYAFRNVFNIPSELIENGCVKLKHHEQMELDPNIDKIEYELRIEHARILQQLSLELKRNKILTRSIQQLKPLHILCKSLRHRLAMLDTKSNLYQQNKIAVQAMNPLRDTLIFIMNKVQEIYKCMSELRGQSGEELENEKLRILIGEFESRNAIPLNHRANNIINENSIKELVQLLSEGVQENV